MIDLCFCHHIERGSWCLHQVQANGFIVSIVETLRYYRARLGEYVSGGLSDSNSLDTLELVPSRENVLPVHLLVDGDDALALQHVEGAACQGPHRDRVLLEGAGDWLYHGLLCERLQQGWTLLEKVLQF